MPGDPSDTAQTWADLEQSGAKLVRTFANWHTLAGNARALELRKYSQFVDKAEARGMRVLIAVGGDENLMPTPAQYAAVAQDLVLHAGRPRRLLRGLERAGRERTSGRRARSRPTTRRC